MSGPSQPVVPSNERFTSGVHSLSTPSVVAQAMIDGEHIWIGSLRDSVTVKDATALRDWLNSVLPTSFSDETCTNEDSARLDYIDRWIQDAARRGFKWDTMAFKVEFTAREQIDRYRGSSPLKATPEWYCLCGAPLETKDAACPKGCMGEAK